MLCAAHLSVHQFTFDAYHSCKVPNFVPESAHPAVVMSTSGVAGAVSISRAWTLMSQ